MTFAKETGSLVNHIHSRATRGQPEPVVGMGATVLHYTDRSPATIIEVTKIGKYLAIVVQGDNAKRIDTNGMSECQTYEYTPNPEGGKTTYRFKNEAWEAIYFNTDTKRWKKSGGSGLRIGEREKYHDFSF